VADLVTLPWFSVLEKNAFTWDDLSIPKVSVFPIGRAATRCSLATFVVIHAIKRSQRKRADKFPADFTASVT
jgi:hypothetical protein